MCFLPFSISNSTLHLIPFFVSFLPFQVRDADRRKRSWKRWKRSHDSSYHGSVPDTFNDANVSGSFDVRSTTIPNPWSYRRGGNNDKGRENSLWSNSLISRKMVGTGQYENYYFFLHQPSQIVRFHFIFYLCLLSNVFWLTCSKRLTYRKVWAKMCNLK